MNRIKHHRFALWIAVAATAFSVMAAGASPSRATAQGTSVGEQPSTSGSCQFASAHGAIQHVIYLQFDNVHFTRDNPNVPSDLEQMPHLLNFITGNGIMLANHHTPLISHTGTDI